MAFQGDSIFWVEVGKIVPNPFQPRREFDEAKLKELSESVRMYGILQPLTVTRKEIQEESGAFYTEYELIAGERRLRASKLAGLEQVPVIIRSGEDTEQEKLELAIIENLQREDLNAVDRALAFKQLAEVFELSHSQVAKKVGRSREYVSNSIRLLGLPEYMLSSLKTGDISEGHARTLLMLRERPEEQDVVYREILLKKLSVREVERIARKIATDKVRKKKWTDTDAELIAIEKEFTTTLGTRVQIAKTDFGGKLTIDYFSDDDLHKLLQMMQTQGKITDTQIKEDNVEGEGTVIREMSPEASLMAKLAVATPLEMMDTKPEVSQSISEEQIQTSNPESLKEELVQQLDEIVSNHVPDVPEVEKKHHSDEVSDMQPQEHGAQTGQQIPPFDIPHQEEVGNNEHTADAYLQSKESDIQESVSVDSEVSQDPVSLPAVPLVQEEVLPDAAVPSSEFAFIQGPNSVNPAPSMVQTSEDVDHAAQGSVAVPDPHTEDKTYDSDSSDDDDLYSMKNFSL